MNKEICKMVITKKDQFIPHLFTEKQIILLEKYLQQKTLTPTEKTYFYSTIKKKIDALSLLREEFYINGEEMLPERVEEAKKILKELNQERAFISGSFLYKKNYEDIDIYVLTKKRKSFQQGKKHFMYITEKIFRNPIYFSSFKYSVANFSLLDIKPKIKKPNFDELITAYEMAVNEILDNDDQKTVRDLVFEYYLQIKKTILNSFSLSQKFYEIKKKKAEEKIYLINNMVKELLLLIYSKRYLYQRLGPFLKNLQQLTLEYKTHDNILIYIKLLEEVKNECRRT